MSHPRRRGAALAALVAAGALVLGAACSRPDEPQGSPGPSGTPTSDAAPVTSPDDAPDGAAAPPLAEVALALEQVAELDAPIALVAHPTDGRLYVAEKGGRVVRLAADAGGPPEVVLDLGDEVLDQGEQGLLGLAFSADGDAVYLDFIHRGDESTRVVEVRLDDGRAGARRELLRVEQPFPNHNGGHLLLGPDGYLYVGLGDGGSGGDPHGHGQDTGTLLGSILRIDPTASTDGRAYAVPADNPFVDGGGAPEIWLYGVRNPWRFSFDRATGDLWIADVGQNELEEVNVLRAGGGPSPGRGANLGWNRMEGSQPFSGDPLPGAVLPVHEYDHDDGCSITGGVVYRGAAIPGLAGTYLFADYCVAELRGIRVEGDDVVDERTWDLDVAGAYSFGEDADGEVYVLLESGPVLRLVAG